MIHTVSTKLPTQGIYGGLIFPKLSVVIGGAAVEALVTVTHAIPLPGPLSKISGKTQPFTVQGNFGMETGFKAEANIRRGMITVAITEVKDANGVALRDFTTTFNHMQPEEIALGFASGNQEWSDLNRQTRTE